MNTIDEMIEVLQAIKEGKEVECRLIEGGTGWCSMPHDCPNFVSFEYRVKKEPLVIWAVVYGDGSAYGSANRSQAERQFRGSGLPGMRLVKFVEEV